MKSLYVIAKKHLVQVVANKEESEPKHLLWITATTPDGEEAKCPLTTAELLALGKIVDSAICAITEDEPCECGTCHESVDNRVARVMRKKRSAG